MCICWCINQTTEWMHSATINMYVWTSRLLSVVDARGLYLGHVLVICCPDWPIILFSSVFETSFWHTMWDSWLVHRYLRWFSLFCYVTGRVLLKSSSLIDWPAKGKASTISRNVDNNWSNDTASHFRRLDSSCLMKNENIRLPTLPAKWLPIHQSIFMPQFGAVMLQLLTASLNKLHFGRVANRCYSHSSGLSLLMLLSDNLLRSRGSKVPWCMSQRAEHGILTFRRRNYFFKF